MNILFFGSSYFAAPILEALIKSKHKVIGVISTPDKKSGRGQKLTPTPVKELAVHHNLQCWTPAKLDEKSDIAKIQSTHADIFVVAGGIIPEQDIEALREIGIQHIFLPGTSTQTIIAAIQDLVGETALE